MPHSEKAITNFTSGELDQRLLGRIDIEQYYNSAQTITNFIVQWYGGVTRTPGTYYVRNVKTSTEDQTLIPFEFSTTQAYMLEFGDLYIRFYKDGGVILSGSSPYEITTVYTEDDVEDLRYAQTADTLYITHESHLPQVLTRSGDTSWTIADLDISYGPLLDLNTTTTTITPSAATGTAITLTASTSIFQSGHVGSIWKVNEGYVEIKTYSSGTSVTADVLYDGNIGGTSAYTTWYEAAWSDVRGYPQYMTFYEQRAVYACTPHQPNGVWITKPNEYGNFDVGDASDSDSIWAVIAARKMNKIEWVVPGDFLAIGNAGGINRMWSGSQSTPITPDNANAKPILYTGSANIEPIQIGGFTHFVQRGDEIVRTLVYNLTSDSFSGDDITKLSRHITNSGIKKMAYQQSPHSVLWCVLNNGDIVTCTINIEEKIVAWTRQTTDGTYLDAEVIPNGTEDQVWVIVEREINGSTVRMVEYFMPFDFGDKEDAFFVDSGLTYSGTATTTITGLAHLEGEELAVLADGYPHPNVTVSTGQITLTRSTEKAQIGLPKTAIIETNPLEAGSAIGSAQGKYKKLLKIIVKFYETVGGNVVYGGNSYPFKYQSPYDLVSGNIEMLPPMGYNKSVTIRITQDLPLPMTINGIYPYMNTND